MSHFPHPIVSIVYISFSYLYHYCTVHQFRMPWRMFWTSTAPIPLSLILPRERLKFPRRSNSHDGWRGEHCSWNDILSGNCLCGHLHFIDNIPPSVHPQVVASFRSQNVQIAAEQQSSTIATTSDLKDQRAATTKGGPRHDSFHSRISRQSWFMECNSGAFDITAVSLPTDRTAWEQGRDCGKGSWSGCNCRSDIRLDRCWDWQHWGNIRARPKEASHRNWTWLGSVFTLLLRKKYPELIHRMVLLDVGEFPFLFRIGRPTLSWILCIWSYQSLFALSYLLGSVIGFFVLRLFFAWQEYRSRPVSELRSDMACIYVTFLSHFVGVLKEGWSTSNSNSRNVDAEPNRTPLINEGSIPTLFIYGGRKLFMFHENEFVDRVRSTPVGVVREWDCGHWVQEEKEEQWLSTLHGWLEGTNDLVQDAPQSYEWAVRNYINFHYDDNLEIWK